MPEIEIRPTVASDIPLLVVLEHNYTSDHVWQINVCGEENQVQTTFREVRLPRSVRVDYPRSPDQLALDWKERSGLLTALHEGEVVGYVSLDLNIAPQAAWISDLVVARRLRRQGIGTALMLAAQQWAERQHARRLIIEMQSKNHPAISLALKLGFDFCGYHEWYYSHHDIALFFAKLLS